MSTIAVDTLMDETRRIATLYRQTTGQILPVSNELGRYDAAKILSLQPLSTAQKGIDFMGTQGPLQDRRLQVKSRVIFNEKKSGHRIGQLSIELAWDIVLLVLYGENYQPRSIFATTKEEIVDALMHKSHKAPRGLMSLVKFKAISQQIWSEECGLEWDPIWHNQPKQIYG